MPDSINHRAVMASFYRYSRLGVCGGFALCSLRLAAQGDPPESELGSQPYRLNTILVTGEPVGVSLGGGTATLLSGDTLIEKSIDTPRSLTGVVPNLTVLDANGDRLPRFSVRGLRENNFGYGEAAATVYVDGVPFYDSFSRGLPLYNVETAEYLHGPQGTTMGASRPGGVLNLYTRQPSAVADAQARLSYGNYDAFSGSVAFTGPILPGSLSAGLDGLYTRRDGYFHNVVLDTHPDNRETIGGRLQLHATPHERLDLTAAASFYRYLDGALVARPIQNWGYGFHDLAQDYDGSNRQDSQIYSLRGAWRGEAIRLVNVLAYRVWSQELDGDFDFSPSPLVVGFDRPELDQWSEEFRVESADAEASWRWTAGLFASGRRVDRENGFTYGPAWAFYPPPLNGLAGLTQLTTSETKDLDTALFGQITWSPIERLDVTAGLRGELDRREMDRSRVDPATPPFQFESSLDETYRSLQPKAAVEYAFSDAVDSWFSFATGYQPGGFNLSVNDPLRAPFDPADSMHFELGVAGRCWEEQLRASLSLFWIETRDYQVYRPVSLSDFEVLNANRARTLGGQAEVVYEPIRGLDLRVATGVVNAEFTDFTTVDPLTGLPLDLSGKTINFVPQFTLDASVTYRLEMGLYATVGGTVVGEYWFDEDNTLKQPAYGLLNARVGWSNSQFELAVYGRNLLDEEYYANALDLGPSPLLGGFVGTPGDPLQFGVEGAVRF